MSERYYLDPLDTKEYLSRVDKGELPPLLIRVDVSGESGKEVNPSIPETPEEQAEHAAEAYKAGATIVHIHAKSAKNGYAETSSDPAEYRLINMLIRDRCPDMIIDNTLGGMGSTEEERLGIVLESGAEMYPIMLGPIPSSRSVRKRRAPPLEGRPADQVFDQTYVVTRKYTELLAKAAIEKGAKPSLGLTDPSHISQLHELIDKALVRPPYCFNVVLTKHGIPPAPRNLIHLMELMQLPQPSVIFVTSGKINTLYMNTVAITLGCHVRVGLGDEPYYNPGELAKSNVQLVRRVVGIANQLGRKIASPAEAREMLGISERPSRYR
jgi:3-keto-5-aminohexanoate cleavage enzyme